MAEIKSYTDLEQSKKLVEILPHESADMSWCNNSIKGINYTDKYSANLYTVKEMKDAFDKALLGWYKHWELIPCWSLTALLGVLPDYNLQRTDWGNKIEYKIVVTIDDEKFASKNYDNPIDACYELILKLHGLNLL